MVFSVAPKSIKYSETVNCTMPLVFLVLGLIVFQIIIRVWLRLSPQAIPFGWSWLLENPWRKYYRNLERTADQCLIKPSDTVLEIGCGSGLFTRALATRCAKLIVQDLEPRYLAQASSKTKDLTHLEFLAVNVCELQLHGVADVIVLISVLPEIANPVRALEQCLIALKPGGHIVISEELFEPEYVTSQQTDAWAKAAGLKVIGREGNAWVYLNRYAVS
jgi:ubiquinone/menaquinone biosynthesis C-methylase UbiE